MFEILPALALSTSRGIMESLKTIENSAAIEASTINRPMNRTELPGAACHSSNKDRILTTAEAPIQRFL